ncbi:brachyurin-like [Leptinotarsa decemlineata]|uniref:brachyurin-like n=1 Tax=Leptinotarsa decemlineata TaxID=7539 RepID=UPI003D304AF5
MKKILLIFAVFSVSQAVPKLSDYFVHPYQRQHQPRRLPIGLRIIGGNDASPHAYPYQVGMYVYSTQVDFCGGSLISPNYVLTAAHCVDKAYKVEVILGAHNVTAEEDSQVRLVSVDIVVHEEWDRDTLTNDIALIKLPSPVKETDAIKIIDIAAGRDSFVGDKAVTTGWGLVDQNIRTVTPILKYVVSTVLSNAACKKAKKSYDDIITPFLLCISGTGPVGTCQGDSGGPLVVNGVQVGLVSFGYKNCSAGLPSVFTRVSEYVDWIAKNSDVTYR